MTDLHTHILPGMDDGSKDVETSLAMLREERRQGVDTVVLTPHFYRDRERPEWFFSRRKEACLKLGRKILSLPEQEQAAIPQLLLGAEVAWVPNLADWEELPRFCIGETHYLLLELPFTPWNDGLINQLYDLMGKRGITPIIAHLERYMKGQRSSYIEDIFSLGVPIQISADMLLHPMSRLKALSLLRQRRVHVLASDCHNMDKRPPNLGQAMEILERKLGQDAVASIGRRTDRLVNGARERPLGV